MVPHLDANRGLEAAGLDVERDALKVRERVRVLALQQALQHLGEVRVQAHAILVGLEEEGLWGSRDGTIGQSVARACAPWARRHLGGVGRHEPRPHHTGLLLRGWARETPTSCARFRSMLTTPPPSGAVAQGSGLRGSGPPTTLLPVPISHLQSSCSKSKRLLDAKRCH